MMMLPSLFLLSVCLAFGICASVSEEDLEYESTSDSAVYDEDDFVFTELKFDDSNEYPPYPHNIYPLFRALFLHVAQSDERMFRLFVSLISKIGDVSLLNDIRTVVIWKFNRGDFHPYTPDLFKPKVTVQEYSVPTYDSEWNTNEESENATEENLFDQRTGILYDGSCDNCGKPSLQAGSIRGVPGEDFPDYYDIPITTFSCADKYIPGIYADLETGCQVFHVCWPHRRESFLCPIGTIFNQAISSCDYWYSCNCSLSPLYFYSGQLSPKEEVLQESEKTADFLAKSKDETPLTYQDPLMKSKGGKLHGATGESSTNESPRDYKSQATSTKLPQQTESPTRATSQSPLTTTHSTESKLIPTADKSYLNVIWAPKSKFIPIKSKITIYYNSDKSVDQETVRIPSTKLVPALQLPRKPSLIGKKEKSVSEVLQEILKITESMTKEARKFITQLEIDKLKNKLHKSVEGKTAIGGETDKSHGFITVKTEEVIKTPKTTTKKSVGLELKHSPEINPRFIVKPVAVGKRSPEKKVKILPIVTPSTYLKPSELFSTKQI